jgi:hypothetical protein
MLRLAPLKRQRVTYLFWYEFMIKDAHKTSLEFPKPPSTLPRTLVDMVAIQCSDWGTTVIKLNENTLEKILCGARHNATRCINKNGRALANAWLREGRHDRARAVEGSKENWTAWNGLCHMVAKRRALCRCSHHCAWRQRHAHCNGACSVWAILLCVANYPNSISWCIPTGFTKQSCFETWPSFWRMSAS